MLYILLAYLPYRGRAQEYRVIPSPTSLPEIYNTINLIVEKKDATGKYTTITGKYTLRTTEANLYKDELTFDRQLVYRNDGKLQFTLKHAGKEHELALQLPVLQSIRFNLYADSIKPVMNYYVNVEGTFTNGKVYPLDTSIITITCSQGRMQGMEWIRPEVIDFDKVTFTTIANFRAGITDSVIVHLKKYWD
jgi:hypothetical protein